MGDDRTSVLMVPARRTEGGRVDPDHPPDDAPPDDGALRDTLPGRFLRHGPGLLPLMNVVVTRILETADLVERSVETCGYENVEDGD